MANEFEYNISSLLFIPIAVAHLNRREKTDEKRKSHHNMIYKRKPSSIFMSRRLEEKYISIANI